jgi:phosphoadenosine phosphosulfate reductase
VSRRLPEYLEAVKGKDAEGILAWARGEFGERVALATSFGAEDQVLTDLWIRPGVPARIFTLDTGRLYQETYDVFQETRKRYGARIEVFAPDAGELERLVGEQGPNLFYESVEKRKACCTVRKTHPLERALRGLEAWITGLRRDQAVTRTATEPVEWDEAHGLYKINPLFDWSEKKVWGYVQSHAVPVNALHAVGFPSIGCRPCTRAVNRGDDIRSGRWWWESPEHKECGLHNRPAQGKV